MLKRIFVQLVCSRPSAAGYSSSCSRHIFFSLLSRYSQCAPTTALRPLAVGPMICVVKCTILCIVVLVYLENSIRSFSSCLTSFMGATD